MKSGPYLSVQSYEVRHEPGRDIVLAVFVHHGQVFNLMFEAGTALALAGELEAAYQHGMEQGAGSRDYDPLVSRTAPGAAPQGQGRAESADESPRKGPRP